MSCLKNGAGGNGMSHIPDHDQVIWHCQIAAPVQTECPVGDYLVAEFD